MPCFSGTRNARFEDWIRSFSACIATANISEEKKILLLAPKLIGAAADEFDLLKQTNSEGAKSFQIISETLQKRFHEDETHNHYADEYNRCIRLDKESVRDYASRLTKLFKLAYPEIKETKNLLIDKFRSGLQRELREKVTVKEFSSMEKLIQCVEKHVKQVDRATAERQAEARIRMVDIPADPGTE